MKKITMNKKEYELMKDEKDCFRLEETESLVTDYFDSFDYIFGDYSYDKLRLKGFCDKSNAIVSKINDVEGLEKHIKEYCSYGARYFLLRKLK